jgi:hypothetical protein
VRQQTVAHLGELAHGRARAKALARAITSELEQPELFTAPDDPAEAILVRLNRVCLGRGRTLRRCLARLRTSPCASNSPSTSQR